MLQQRSERYVLSDQCRWWSARSLSLSSFCVSRFLVGVLRRSVSTNSRPYTLPRGAGAQWEAARPELEPILLQEVDAAVAGAEKPCWRQCVAGLPDRAAAFLGCSQISLESAKQQLIDKGWLAKVNAVLGRHGLVADLEYEERRSAKGPEMFEVSISIPSPSLPPLGSLSRYLSRCTRMHTHTRTHEDQSARRKVQLCCCCECVLLLLLLLLFCVPQGGPHALEAHTECSYGNTIEVSHAESLLRVLIDACHANANPGGSVMLRNDT